MFELKKSLIEQPFKSLIVNLAAGFIVTIHLIITLAFIHKHVSLLHYHKCVQVGDQSSNFLETSMTPMIALMSELIAIVVISGTLLTIEALKRGLFTWLRHSFGLLIQRLILFSCLLATFVNLRNYIGPLQ